VPESHFCGGGGGGGAPGTQGVPCWDSFVCYTVDC